MLLELRDLSRSLQDAGITVSRTDDHLVAYSRSRPAFWVEVDSGGRVCTVRPIEQEAVARLRKYECSSGGYRESTPGFNIDPLYRPGPGESKEAYEKEVAAFARDLERGKLPVEAARRDRLQGLLSRSEPNWQDKARAINQSLRVAPRVLLDRLGQLAAGEEPPLALLRELLRRSQLLDADRLRAQLLDHARRAIQEAGPQSRPGRL